ncbi:MAG: hypothetical protein O3B72_05705, partial [Proteobacteria bacterium]|nr:hypothetical protein [Pseudomonadota bacterium]
MASNIVTVAEAVDRYHDQTGRWFPAGGENAQALRLFPNPFDGTAKPYQGLEEETLGRENQTINRIRTHNLP